MERRKIGMILISVVILKSTVAFATLRVGSQAPAFSLKDEKGSIYSLELLKGKKVALVFYPKPNTSHCTKQACSLRDKFSELKDAGITVLGISKGTQATMRDFKDTHKLSFPLLQADDAVLEKYGTKGGAFHLFLPKRYTILINEQGTIVAILKNIEVDNHAEQILQEFTKNSKKK
ncbi:peroxiredoxin [Candidatus Dependentiae bacterium]|nr:peroxiredoxin [Candidatus Dependentiae bacterium]